jgi:hypothetical protein
MKIALFLFYRAIWAFSLKVLETLAKWGCSALILEIVPRLFGLGWAFRGLRRLGWHPDDLSL